MQEDKKELLIIRRLQDIANKIGNGRLFLYGSGFWGGAIHEALKTVKIEGYIDTKKTGYAYGHKVFCFDDIKYELNENDVILITMQNTEEVEQLLQENSISAGLPACLTCTWVSSMALLSILKPAIRISCL